jgi:predicted DNA-binding protein
MVLKKGSIRYVISFPPGLKERAEALAKADGRPLNNWLVRVIEGQVYASMRHLTINVQIKLKMGSIIPDGMDDIDQEGSLSRFLDELNGRIAVLYPSANVVTQYDYGEGAPVVRVYMYPTNTDLESLVQEDVEAIIADVAGRTDDWMVKRP